MALKKSQRSNLIFLGIIALIFFTPLRGMLQEYSAKLFSFAPSIEKVEDRVVVSDYNWSLKGLNVRSHNFKDSKNKVVFINFWATWCPPCRAEMPEIQELYNDYKGKVDFLFITNENETTVTKFLDKNNYTLPSYNRLTKDPKEFQVSSIPATYLLNKKGEIVIHKVGVADWNSEKVRKLLDELLLE